MRANATRIDTLLYTVESRKSCEQTQADLLVNDPAPEKATALLKDAFPAPVPQSEQSEHEQNISQGVRQEAVGTN